MRDSLMAGTSLILKLNQGLMLAGQAETWNFVHILITDGEDTGSKASLEQAAAVMHMVGQRIPVSRCRTIIIGIDLAQDRKAREELTALQRLGGESCELHEIGSVEISSLFNRIQVSLGLVQQTGIGVVQSRSGAQAVVISQRIQPVMQVSRASFAVVFNIDISGSMAGSRFERVKQSVAQFLANTPATDLVAGICFNQEVKLLAGMPERRPEPESNCSLL
jgi:Mg-chelatase subunit ChlD